MDYTSQSTFNIFIIVALIVAALAFLYALWLFQWVKKQPANNKRIIEVGKLIREGSDAFMRKEYIMLAKFIGALSLLIFVFLPHPVWNSSNILNNLAMALATIAGAIFSGTAGIIGMKVATVANVRTAEAAKKGIKPSFLAGFRGGAVMGMAVVGSTLLGVGLIMLLTGDASLLLGFSFGATVLALFAKAGGGVFTKTADLSADLVGKVELGIPEDDPRNPAVIADNVGDNVGDVAGMGADLFDSSIASSTAALVLGIALDGAGSFYYSSMVLCFVAIGLFSSIIGVGLARMGKRGNPTSALNNSTYFTTGIFGVLITLATWLLNFEWRVWGAAMVGMFIATLVGIASDYFTNDEKKPVRNCAQSAESGPALTIISGLSYGLLSVIIPMVGIGISALAAYHIVAPLGTDGAMSVQYGMYGIAMAAVGMLSIVAMIMANDAYGPIVDNARGLAEMGNLGDKVLGITDQLDSAGNTVKAITKGFAIGAAGLTVIALLGAFISESNDYIAYLAGQGVTESAFGRELVPISLEAGINLTNPMVFFGILVGAAIPAVFSAMLMLGVNRNSKKMIAEIHRQFDEIEGLKEGKPGVEPDYNKCIEIATVGALRELLPAGIMAIAATLVVGFIGGVQAVAGFLAGNIISGLLLALFMSNAGGMWDNAKKYIEAGNFGGKGSDAHKAGVIGDTVGDPFKDTAGPSINTQITAVSLIASIAAALFIQFSIF